MITKFKLFENIEIKLSRNVCWIIFGNLSHCVEILKKLKEQLNVETNIDLLIEQMDIIKNDTNYLRTIGIIIFYNRRKFSYMLFERYKREFFGYNYKDV